MVPGTHLVRIMEGPTESLSGSRLQVVAGMSASQHGRLLCQGKAKKARRRQNKGTDKAVLAGGTAQTLLVCPDRSRARSRGETGSWHFELPVSGGLGATPPRLVLPLPPLPRLLSKAAARHLIRPAGGQGRHPPPPRPRLATSGTQAGSYRRPPAPCPAPPSRLRPAWPRPPPAPPRLRHWTGSGSPSAAPSRGRHGCRCPVRLPVPRGVSRPPKPLPRLCPPRGSGRTLPATGPAPPPLPLLPLPLPVPLPVPGAARHRPVLCSPEHPWAHAAGHVHRHRHTPTPPTSRNTHAHSSTPTCEHLHPPPPPPPPAEHTWHSRHTHAPRKAHTSQTHQQSTHAP